MQYEGDVYRPPSEAHSLLVQVTIGCAWNKCTFCYMYKDKSFRVRSFEEIDKDLVEGSRYAGRVRRVFLCDGDALALSTGKLTAILRRIDELYPGLEGVRAYASAADVTAKTAEELAALRVLGLDMVYLGLESGSDEILRAVRKGGAKRDMIDAAALLHEAGIKQSVSIISGLGGAARWREHMAETADALNQMQPEYVGLLALMLPRAAGYADETEGGPLQSPGQPQTLREMKLLIESLELRDCLFTSAHASNYDHFRGYLPRNKPRLLAQIERALAAAEQGGGDGVRFVRRL